MNLFIIALKTPKYPVMPQFARDAVECAKRYSKCDVVAITDHDEPGWITDRSFFETASKMVDLCDESHLKDEYCWNNMTPMQRWAIIHDFVTKNGIKSPIFSADWDILVFGDVQKHLEKFDYLRYDVCDLYAKEATPPIDHLAPYAVQNLDAIGYFCETAISRFRWKCPSLKHGFGSDMGWWWVTKSVGGFTAVDVGKEVDGAIIDNNLILNRDIYVDDDGYKKIVMVDGIPHFVRQDNGALVRAIAVHCFMYWKEKTHRLLGRNAQ